MENSLDWCHKIKNGKISDWLLSNDRFKIPYSQQLDKLCFTILGQNLLDNGYIVLPLFNKSKSEKLVKEFQKTELEFPEYKRDIILGTKENPYVLGGFGAYGQPSSFHNPFVRNIRKEKCRLIPILGEMLKVAQKRNLISNAKDYKVAQLMDRMCKRPKNTSTTKESYHRDLLPKGRDLDITIGGWIQFSEDSSFFSCTPKTHSFPNNIKKGKKGFATETEMTCTSEIEVPQGHIIMFFQNLGHCVHSIKRKSDSYRLFSVWLLTIHDTHIYDYSLIIQNQGVPFLASHQKPWMYTPNHGSFWLDRMTIPWSKRVFIDNVLIQKIKKDGSIYTIVESPMKSLQEYGLQLYPKYKKWEKDLFIPQQEFCIGETQKIYLFLP